MIKNTFLLLTLLLCACQGTAPKQESKNYPDIRAYFQAEINRLNAKKPLIEKTVCLNKQSETQTISGIKWEEELQLFVESDINKPAFKDLYQVEKKNKEAVYRAKKGNLKTQEIQIYYADGNKIKQINIRNRTENNLYSSEEFLAYCPDSVYQIVKKQKVKILGANNYRVLGKFKN